MSHAAIAAAVEAVLNARDNHLDENAAATRTLRANGVEPTPAILREVFTQTDAEWGSYED